MKKNIVIILLILIILGLGLFIGYDKFIKKQPTCNCKKTEVKEEKDTVKLEKELSLNEICSDAEGICNKKISFKLNGKSREIEIYVNMDDLYNEELDEKLNYSEEEIKKSEETNAFIVGSKRIKFTSGHTLDKISIVGEKYIAVGEDSSISPNGYSISIYDEDFNLVKTYSSIHVKESETADEAILADYAEYFKVNESSFTRYSCNTSNASPSGENEILEEYLITIKDDIFTESKLSETLRYCSSQYTQ